MGRVCDFDLFIDLKGKKCQQLLVCSIKDVNWVNLVLELKKKKSYFYTASLPKEVYSLVVFYTEKGSFIPSMHKQKYIVIQGKPRGCSFKPPSFTMVCETAIVTRPVHFIQ